MYYLSRKVILHLRMFRYLGASIPRTKRKRWRCFESMDNKTLKLWHNFRWLSLLDEKWMSSLQRPIGKISLNYENTKKSIHWFLELFWYCKSNYHYLLYFQPWNTKFYQLGESFFYNFTRVPLLINQKNVRVMNQMN